MDDDLTLVGRARDGDTAAFELLVRRHTASLWRLARSLLGDDGTAEEVVQDTFLKAHRALAGFRGESAVGTWLHAICHRTAIDKRRRRQLNVVPLEVARWTASPARADEDRVVVEQALGKLADEERTAFTLVAVLGYRSEEASAVVGVPASTVRSRVARARRRLAEALAGEAQSEVLA